MQKILCFSMFVLCVFSFVIVHSPADAAQNDITKRLGVELEGDAEEELVVTPSPDGKIHIVDDTGHTLTFDVPATRVVALYGAFTEMLLALGLQNSIVGRTAADKHLTAIEDLPIVGTHMRPNIEKILSLQPDVIVQFLGRQDTETLGLGLRQMGIPVIFFRLETFDDMFRALITLGKLTNAEHTARTLVAEYRDRLGDLNNALLDQKRVPLVYEVRYPHLLAVAKESMADSIIHVAGGRNIITSPTKFIRLDEEHLAKLDPEAYIIQKGPMNIDPQPVHERPHYAGMRAVKNNRVLIVDEVAFARPGPRAIDSAEMLARWLHPHINFDLFRDED